MLWTWQRAIAWLEEHSRWNQLRTLGDSNLVNASVLMPAFGYMLLLNDNVHQYLTIKYDGWLLHHLPSIWRIWLLFYGSFFLAIATILYSIYCPSQVKRYASRFAMADAEREHHMRLGQETLVRELLGDARDRMTKIQIEAVPAFDVGDENPNYLGTDPLARISNMLIWIGFRCVSAFIFFLRSALLCWEYPQSLHSCK
jgi:hypothetical protein